MVAPFGEKDGMEGMAAHARGGEGHFGVFERLAGDGRQTVFDRAPASYARCA
jgi:hypothetical protein